MKRMTTMLALFLSCMLLLVGCSKSLGGTQSSTKTITYQGKEYTVPNNPERTAVLANSVAYMLYELGVIPSARTLSTDKLPEALEKVPVIGQTTNVNIEALISNKPNFVIGISPTSDKYKDALTNNKIPYMIISYDGINDNVPLLETLGKIYNKEDKANAAIKAYQEKIQKIKDSIKNEKPKRVAVLFASGKSITAETEKATGASLVKELGIIDVVASHIKPDQKDMKYIPYSLETLAFDNPDVILIVTMGKRSEVDENMKRTLTDNPAWANLTAVKNNRVVYLPNDLFLLNPGLRTPDALAELVREVYGINPIY